MRGFTHITTKAPRYSPKIQRMMEGAYETGLSGLMSPGKFVDIPEAQGSIDIPQIPQRLPKTGPLPKLGRISQPQVRDVAQTQMPHLPRIGELTPQALPEMPPEDKLPELNFDPIERQAMGRFKRETIPTIAERFAATGGMRGSGFAKTVGAAGAQLQESLAAMRARMEPQYALQRAQLGLQRGALSMQRGRLGLEQQLGLGRLETERGLGVGRLAMERAGLGQREQQMRLQRDLGLGGLQMQRAALQQQGELGLGRIALDKAGLEQRGVLGLAGLGLQRAGMQLQQQRGLQDYGLRRAQLLQQQQSQRRQEYLGLLGFRPPVMYGQPQSTTIPF